jgi:hypothetical protein
MEKSYSLQIHQDLEIMNKTIFSVVMFALGSACHLAAGPIISATSAVINSGGPGSGSITNTIDQSGLSSGYVSGVTDFDTYLASNPTHTVTFSGYEWFSQYGTSSAIVTYDLGSLKTIDALALWNEESSGIGLLNLLSSSDNITFTAFASGLTPFDNPLGNNVSYPAEVFSFSAVTTRYVRFEISNSPQLDPGSYPAAAIGEVAFREGSSSRVPDNGSTLGLIGGALVALVSLRRRFAK